jgi:large subunit ribosomal protein L25
MGEKITLTLSPRELHGKKVAKLRREGLVPGVVYGAGFDPVSVQIDAVVLEKTFRSAGKHHPIHITVDGKKRIAMIKDVEHGAVRRGLRHVSFHAVKASDPVVAEVPIHLIGEGESEAEKAGLIVLQALDKIEVRALPMDLPDAVEISIVNLKEAGEKVTLADAKLPEGVEFVEHDDGHHEEEDEERPSITDLQVASVWEPAALQAQNDAAAGDAESVDDVEADNGGDTDQDSQLEETRPGGKGQDEPKQSSVDASK